MSKQYLGALLIIAILGLALRIAAPAGRWLWQDEAETAINSLQVLERGYPHDRFKGKPIYENEVFIPSSDPVYAYESTNYFGSKFERNKGWLTYYYQAVWFWIFGFSTFIARLPFALLFIGSLCLLVYLARAWFNDKVAIIAAFIYAFNYYGIYYESQSRYYSLVIFLSLLAQVFFYLAVKRRIWTYYLASAAVLAAMLYTHPVAAGAQMAYFVLLHWLTGRRTWRSLANAKLAAALGLSVASFLPWVITVRLWETFGLFPDPRLKIIWPALALFAWLATRAAKKIWPPLANWPEPFRLYLWPTMLCVAFIKPLLIPAESFAGRLFIEYIPLLPLILAYYIAAMYPRHFSQTILLQAAVAFGLPLTLLQSSTTTPNFYQTGWVKETVDYLEQAGVSKSVPIFVSYQQLTFRLYSDYNVELVWPIRKSFFDNYPGEIYFVIDNNGPPIKIFFRKNTWQWDDRDKGWPWQDLNFYEKIQTCDRTDLNNNVSIYYCAPSSKSQ